jgi:hypothetical protein
MRELDGETAIEFMRPLVNPQLPAKTGLVGKGPIERQPGAACGVNDSVRKRGADFHALNRASCGSEPDG